MRQVYESEVYIKERQLGVTDVRVELLRQEQLTNGSFDLITLIPAIQKLRTREVSFGKLWVERLRPIISSLARLPTPAPSVLQRPPSLHRRKRVARAPARSSGRLQSPF